ncbi:MAG: putative sulfate exporter family transporter [Ferruginibacter sp.]|nr:putative sulfate exporter family transporter [Ferruginibacter sp.]
MTKINRKIQIHEDWLVVLIASAIIIFFINGFISPVPVFNWNNLADFQSKICSVENLQKIFYQFLWVAISGVIAAYLSGKKVLPFLLQFTFIWLISITAIIIAGNKQIKAVNLEAVIFSLSIGLIIGNVFRLPQWFRQLLSAEVFVKIGLVLLGTSIIFSDILKAGLYGIVQSLVVVISVWYFSFWVCRKLKIDKELALMLSSAVSICGVSAAIATSGAIKGDNKKLSYVISLVLIVAIPMMIGMPYISKLIGLSQAETGAWLGGSIDTSGAVVAAGTLVGEEALKISTIVKFSQNVLLGIAAFLISVYWTYTKKSEIEGVEEKPTLQVIWNRFPKFVLGFIAASVIFSFVLDPQIITGVKDNLKSIQTLWFVLAFTSIGLETNFSDLFTAQNRKPLYAFLVAQLFNVIITLIMAVILF